MDHTNSPESDSSSSTAKSGDGRGDTAKTLFECSVCHRTYQSKGGLSKHFKIHHHDQWMASQNEKENGNIFCHVCTCR